MKKKNRMGKIALIAVTACMLAGCGDAETPIEREPVENSLSVEVTLPDAGTVDEISQSIASSHEEDNADNDAVVYTAVNNGGHFVAYNDRVFFHAPVAAGMETTALFGEFNATASGETALYSVDRTGKLTQELPDAATGGLYVTGDRMLFTGVHSEDGSNYTNIYNLTENKAEIASDDHRYMLGADKLGNYALAAKMQLEDADGYSYYKIAGIAVYKDGVYYKDLSVDFDTFVGTGDGRVFYIVYEGENYAAVLMQMNIETEEITRLGVLPEPEYGGCIVDEFVCENGTVFLAYDSYEGTGHFFSGGFYVKASADQPDSLTFEDADGGEERHPFRIQNGSFATCEGTPGAAETRGNTIGYYNADGKWVQVAEGEYDAVFSADYEKLQSIELVEYLDNCIYGVRNYMEHVPDDDIGWRTAYRRNKTEIFMVDCSTGKETVILTVVQ